ncbi:MAG: PQQ-binding-like beta-propeller repeat protein [Aquabacterium sp.]|uniref:outer membrane protein assembly factor BamB family protein n=1 Tax=Aquabacterium sp. TaxID=1872578 RepID=UPI002724C4F4|nr:PQQ-binding-like beta-propeller repeat protein [Aquabacterium sp.]MDO9003361.1 PQQ-binding-like beta-propeller repeat protein [Aquabacterium sp.]
MTFCLSRLLTMACVATAALAAGHAQAAKCTDTINTSSALLSNGFAFNTANTRNQASSINSSNVASLTLAYTHVAEGTIEKKGAPAVTQQTVYFSEGRDIVAANRVGGCEYWRYSGLDKTTPFIGSNAIRSSSVYFLPGTLFRPAMVYGGDFYGNFYGVNAKTGALVWKAFVGTDAGRHFITGSPQAYNGTLFIPVATKEVITTVVDLLTACCFTHGLLQAVDPYTGKVKWTYHTSADAKYNPNTGTRGPNGMSLWGTPMIDAANGSIIIGTGQNLSLPATTNSDSIIALNINTGAVKWVYQSTAGDAWNAACQAPSGLDSHCSRPEGGDFDFGAPPILATLPNGSKAIIAGAKNGAVYSLNPKTGTLNWTRRLGAGGSLGGIHWGMAVDTKNVYAAVTDIWVNKIQRLSIADLLALQGAIGDNMGPVPNAKPGLYALDLSTGNLVWEKHLTHDYQGTPYATLFSAALSVTNDVLLAGSLNGEVKAFRTSNGEELWSYNTAVGVIDVNGVAGKGGTIDSVGAVPAGKDLFVNSGYGSFGGLNPWQAGEGNALFVFRLP